MAAKYIHTFAFLQICNRAFDQVDQNKDGEIDTDELTIAMCHMHYKLAKRAPGITSPPTRQKVAEKMKRYGFDDEGTLNKDQFNSFAKKWFDREGAFFIARILFNVVVSMVIVPGSAAMLQKDIPLVRRLPREAFKVIVGFRKYDSSTDFEGISFHSVLCCRNWSEYSSTALYLVFTGCASAMLHYD